MTDESMFRLMADALPQIVWITDAEGRAEFFNRQWTAYTGRPWAPTTAAEVAGSAVHPDDAAVTMERFEEARRTGGTFQVEHRIRAASGEYRWFLVRAEPHRDPAGGQVVRWFGSSTDIHDRRRDEETLRASEARYRMLFAELQSERELLRALIRDVPAPVALQLGPEHRFALLSDAFREISGGRDLTGMTPQEAYPEVVGSGILERFDEVVATGEPWVSRETHARFDRRGQGIEDCWFDIRYQPVRDAAGQVVGLLNFSFDVTEQVRARRAVEELLAESERARREAEAARAEEGRARGEAETAAARLRRLQDATTALSAATSFEELARALRDTAAGVLDASAALLYRLGDARFGEDPETLYSALIADAGGFGADVPGRWRTVPLAEQAAVAETVRIAAPVYQATPAERARRYPHLMSQSMSTPFGSWAMLPLLVEGRPVGSLALAWPQPQPGGSFSEADRALATVLAAQCAVSLERVRLYAAERAARERAEAALDAAESARAAAEGANRAKSEFLAVMSHELRTPLNAIGGYAELIELGIRGPVTEGQRADLARIQQSQRHLLGLINQVLNYTRIDAGAVRYDLGAVVVRDALAAAEALVLPQARARGLTLVPGDCGPGLVARADPDKLQQILLNLLTNAVKFTEPEGTVRMTCVERPGRVEITVTDTGVGIVADKLAHIFEPFVQVDQRLTRPHEGVGLGLAISRELARGMGGDLVAASTPGAGSVFTLVLPRA